MDIRLNLKFAHRANKQQRPQAPKDALRSKVQPWLKSSTPLIQMTTKSFHIYSHQIIGDHHKKEKPNKEQKHKEKMIR